MPYLLFFKLNNAIMQHLVSKGKTMKKIRKESIETLKDRIDILDVVSSHIELTKKGASYKACCPFHGEKTPSFTVNTQRQTFKCFGCGAGGDAIQFVIDYKKLSYIQAIESIASQMNFVLEYRDDKRTHTYQDNFKGMKELRTNIMMFNEVTISNTPDSLPAGAIGLIAPRMSMSHVKELKKLYPYVKLTYAGIDDAMLLIRNDMDGCFVLEGKEYPFVPFVLEHRPHFIDELCPIMREAYDV